ncbi:MAG: hypothetical protein UV38_C0004G0013 [candidate division TM6 bacterium GW2011_GWE2_42_60]|nr:MAG: hypothetical protein UV38_C0004G0013 [candidate division TM6 bacterium GW2011_GWE2_42_60]HBY05891.1 hypothetical protein [Candidatus Dependentiae bacterium]
MKNLKGTLLVLGACVFAQSAQADCCSTNGGGYSCSDCYAAGDYTGQTFFTDVVIKGAIGTPEHEVFFRRNVMTARKDGCGSALEVGLLGGASSAQGTRELGKWFGLNYKSKLVATTRSATNPANPDLLADDADIDAYHFNIKLAGDADFTSTIQLCPKNTFVGVDLAWKQVLCEDDEGGARYWFELNMPIMRVKNEVRLSENISEGADVDAYTDTLGIESQPYVNSMRAAFMQPGMKYGRITSCIVPAASTTTTNNVCCGTSNCCSTSNNCCDMKRTRVSEIDLRLGHNWASTPCCSLDGYLGLVIPTGNQSCAKSMFEAMVGTYHFALQWGSEVAFTMYKWDDCDASLMIRTVGDGRYYFSRNEWRTFDLVGKQWSRYMQIFKNQEDMIAFAADGSDIHKSFGVNYLTRCVKISPRAAFNWNTGLVYEGPCYTGELGWTLYTRQADYIQPCWEEGPVLAGTVAPEVDTTPISKARTIRDRYGRSDSTATEYDRLKIKAWDINWNSGSQPAVLGYTFYGAAGYKWGECYPSVLSIGGGYDFGHSNTLLHRWTLFGKLAVSF